VVLHDNDMIPVADKLKNIAKITRFDNEEVEIKVKELEKEGKVLLLITHLEKAEFLAYQFMNEYNLQVTLLLNKK